MGQHNKQGKNGTNDSLIIHEGWQHLAPQRISPHEGQRVMQVYVEGYNDIAFWRGVFDDFESDDFTFEISVPLRHDLAKGKKTVMNLVEREKSPYTLFCVDSDFDYLFAENTAMAKIINKTPNIFHTYAYAIENYLCFAPSLHNICVKATKNDIRIFDFESFLNKYSETIFPLFLWYTFSARMSSESVFTLADFRSSVKINYLELHDNGAATLNWLRRQVERRLKTLRDRHSEMERHFPAFRTGLYNRGVTDQNAYLFMQGHTLMDNVVMPMLDAVCDKLKSISTSRINFSQCKGIALSNEQNSYKNALQDTRAAITFNENYKECFLYKRLKDDIQNYLHHLKSGREE